MTSNENSNCFVEYEPLGNGQFKKIETFRSSPLPPPKEEDEVLSLSIPRDPELMGKLACLLSKRAKELREAEEADKPTEEEREAAGNVARNVFRAEARKALVMDSVSRYLDGDAGQVFRGFCYSANGGLRLAVSVDLHDKIMNDISISLPRDIAVVSAIADQVNFALEHLREVEDATKKQIYQNH